MPRGSPTAPRRDQVCPKMALTGPQVPQDGRRMSQVGFMVAPWRPEGAQDGHKEVPEGPKMAPRRPQNGPKRDQDGAKIDHHRPRESKLEPTGPNVKNIEKP